jgi:hypothetical protein
MLDHTFVDCVQIGYWVEEDDEVGDDTIRLRHFRSEEMDLVCECTWEALLADVVALSWAAFKTVGRRSVQVPTNSLIPRSDGSDEGGGAVKRGKCVLEVYDSDTSTRSVCIWDEVWVEQGTVMSKVHSNREKS